jgi:ATP-binding cassette subfamily F protein 1
LATHDHDAKHVQDEPVKVATKPAVNNSKSKKKDKKDGKKGKGKYDDDEEEEEDDDEEDEPVKVATKPAVGNSKSKKDGKKGQIKDDHGNNEEVLEPVQIGASLEPLEALLPRVESLSLSNDDDPASLPCPAPIDGTAGGQHEGEERPGVIVEERPGQQQQCGESSLLPIIVPIALSIGSSADSHSQQPSPAGAPQRPSVPIPTAAVVSKSKPKTKLELKLEKGRREKAIADALELERRELERRAALEREEREKEAAAILERLAAEEAAAKKAEDDDEDEDDEDEDDDGEEEEVGGAFVEKSAEEKERESRMLATMFGDEVFSEHAKPNQEETAAAADADGGSSSSKKLSKKALRKKSQEEERKLREVESNKQAIIDSAEGAQFAVSQSIVDPNDPMWQNALDIIIPSLSISAHKKELFVNAELSIVHGRRYGLVGPNGAGKSTLLKMIASGQLKVPPRLDYLYVEQEVVADDTPAVDAVLRADK